MDGRLSAIGSALLLAALAALLYYIGWVYLSFYLDSFGISISELDLDVHTVLIYSVPPLLTFLAWLAGFAAVLLILAWLAHRFLQTEYQTGLEAVKKITTRFRAYSPWAMGAVAILVAICSFPLIRHFAQSRADQKWDIPGIDLTAFLDEGRSGVSWPWYAQYADCATRQVLDLVFADRKTYYLLCVSDRDPATAVVYEVRREAGLASVRRLVRTTK